MPLASAAPARPVPARPAPARTTVFARDGSPQPDAPLLPPRKAAGGAKPEHEILFQHFFKSVGPRTYAAQVKRAGNGNHYVVLTEGQRDEKTGDVRKTRLFVFSEDFDAFFDLLRRTGEFIRANPVPPEIRRKREAFWAKHNAGADTPSGKPRQAPPALRHASAALSTPARVPRRTNPPRPATSRPAK